MRLVPSRRQWSTWSLPAKASFVGAIVGVLALLLTVAIPYWNRNDERPNPTISVKQTSSGPQSPNVSGIGGNATFQYGSAPVDSSKQPVKKK
jgi:hypothetical protein